MHCLFDATHIHVKQSGCSLAYYDSTCKSNHDAVTYISTHINYGRIWNSIL